MADKEQAHKASWKYLPPGAAFRRAVTVVDDSKLLPIVEHNLVAATGRPREFTAKALLVCLTLHSLSQEQDTKMIITKITARLRELTPSQRHELGVGRDITYPMLWHAFRKITRKLENGGLAIPNSTDTMTVEQLTDRLLAASIPPTHQLPAAIALDGTDLETWARRRSWANKKALSKAGTEIPAGTTLAPANPVNEPGWPLTGLDGRPQNSLDPDARDGYRSGHNGRPGDIYIGYELHLATPIPAIGGQPIPHPITGMTVTPAGSHRGHAGVRTIDGMLATGSGINELCADRGYTFCAANTFTLPMLARGIDVWSDLHPNQRGQRPGPIPGTIWIDGTLFTDALPKSMRTLPGPGRNANAEEKLELRAAFDRRQAYAFTPLAKRDKDGYQRLKGPALAGLVRCVNRPQSMRLPHTRPATSCTSSSQCACSKTVTIGPGQSARERQPRPWGTTDWAIAYGRRSAIESGNAELKTHRLNIRRGFTRVFGAVRNTLLIAFAIAGMNVRLLREWHSVRRLADPRAFYLSEADLADGGGPIHGKHTRARRRDETLPELIAHPPPDSQGQALPEDLQ